VAAPDGCGGGGAPRLFTIPQTAPFLDHLARAILSGNLPVPGGPAPDPLALTRVTLLLPTRRACRAMREAFLREGGGEVVLLPAIRALGDVDEEAAFFAEEAGAGDGLALELPETVGTMERRLVMMELILKWSEVSSPLARPAASPAQAAQLADGLIRLMDMVETEQADLSGLETLVPDRFARHWQETIAFLEILTKEWPAILAERGRMSPYARRGLLMAAEAERIAEAPPADPIIAAGSTGSIPATARLLRAIARAPMGAVVLPGLDLELDKDSWDDIAGRHPEHPQFGMQQLLARIGAAREDVAWLPGSAPDEASRARLRLVSETMRPAGTTERWQDLMTPETRGTLAEGAKGIARIEAATGEAEAEAVALILRRAMERPEGTAALVTPDRTLARRVTARMEKWGVMLDDSAGRPLAKTPPGIFMDLVAEVAESGFAPVALLSLLKHPLARLGRPEAAIRGAARTLEIAALRGHAPASGLIGMAAALAEAANEVAEGRTRRLALSRLTPRELDEAACLVADLERAFAPLDDLHRSGNRAAITDLVRAHVAAAEAVARTEQGEAGDLWRGEAGEALSVMLAQVLSGERPGPPIAAADYADVYRAFTAPLLVRETRGTHPRLFIWGPLEARLQRAGVVVLGGLNEGTWPRSEDVDAWFSRPMRDELGLPQPERRLGLSAHDVAQLLGAGEVYLTRALKLEGVPSVPSRWLLRLEAPWLGWVLARDHVETYAEPRRPAPCPPVEARPRRLSVTRIEEWIANPYAIFARDILELEPLGELAAPPDAAMRGQLVHDALARFVKRHPEGLPADIVGEMMAIADELFEEIGAHASVRAFWRPQFERFAAWFAETEPARRAGVERSFGEVRGGMEIAAPAGPFTLRARADRIDRLAAGGLAIYDYKTGMPPNQAEVADGRAPQLALEAAIAAAGGFDGIAPAQVAALRYVWASGGRVAGEEREASRRDPGELGALALADLARLIAQFDRPETPYPALRRRQFARKAAFDDYAHLARAPEWIQGFEGG